MLLLKCFCVQAALLVKTRRAQLLHKSWVNKSTFAVSGVTSMKKHEQKQAKYNIDSNNATP